MSDHFHAPAPNPDDDKLPNQPFFSWLKNRTTLFVSQFFALLGFIYVPASTIYYVGNIGGHGQYLSHLNPYILIIVDAAHVIILAFFSIVMLRTRRNNKIGTYRTQLAYERLFGEKLDDRKGQLRIKQGRRLLGRFKLYFLLFWLAMFALYASFFIKHIRELNEILASQSDAEASSHAPENRDAAPPTAQPAKHQDISPDKSVTETQKLKESLASKSAASPDKSGTATGAANDQSKNTNERPLRGFTEIFDFLFFKFLTFALNNVSMMFIFWCFIITYLPAYDSRSNARRQLYVSSSSFFFIMFTISYPLLLVAVYSDGFTIQTLTRYATVFDGVSGVFNAVVLALLIARLNSKLIGLRSRLILLLYFYSAVQPLFAVFEQSDPVFKIIQTSVLIIVFGFKVYFFLIIVYALQTGRMLNYLICFPHHARRVNSIWDNQFEVKAKQKGDGSFHLDINRKNEKVYTGSDHLYTIEDCDSKDTELREVMRRDTSYYPDKQSGTHRVDVKNSHRHKIFHSHDLKSEEEAEELIKESMDKIPYCKYTRDI
jgi:hypothetical protein